MTARRLARAAALVAVVLALWWARAPKAAPRAVVLALPGAAADVLGGAGDAAWSASGPALETPGARFWLDLAAGGQDEAGRLEPPPAWAEAGASMRVFAAPSRLFGFHPEGAGFLGTSSGVLVDAANVVSGRMPPPYDRALDAISSGAASLGQGEWTSWIDVEAAPVSNGSPPSGRGRFQFARASEVSYFFSPVYRSLEGMLATSPFLGGQDRDLRPLLASHALEVASTRLAQLDDAFSGADLRPVLVFDTAAEDVEAAFAPDAVASASRDALATHLDSALEAARHAAGAEGVVVVVGGPGTRRKTGGSPWCRIYDGAQSGGGEVAAATAERGAIVAAARHALGLDVDADLVDEVPRLLARRRPVRARPAEGVDEAPHKVAGLPWTPASLASVPGALGGSGN